MQDREAGHNLHDEDDYDDDLSFWRWMKVSHEQLLPDGGCPKAGKEKKKTTAGCWS